MLDAIEIFLTGERRAPNSIGVWSPSCSPISWNSTATAAALGHDAWRTTKTARTIRTVRDE